MGQPGGCSLLPMVALASLLCLVSPPFLEGNFMEGNSSTACHDHAELSVSRVSQAPRRTDTCQKQISLGQSWSAGICGRSALEREWMLTG